MERTRLLLCGLLLVASDRCASSSTSISIRIISSRNDVCTIPDDYEGTHVDTGIQAARKA